MTTIAVTATATPAAADTVKVLINLDSVFNTNSIEKQQAEALGYSVTQVTGTQWRAMTQADFAQYQALVVGDRCSSVPASVTDTADTWAPVVMGTAVNTSPGNRIVIGTDPPTHSRTKIVKAGIGFAATQPGRTGLYYDDGGCASTPASRATLAKISVGSGAWTTGPAPCGGSVAFISSAAGFSGVTTADLAGWGCSVHITYPTFPDDFSPLAVATDTSTHPVCGTNVDNGATACGQAYILISGSGVVAVAPNLAMSPTTASVPTGTHHTVTATLAQSGAPLTGKLVKFTVSGQNAGTTGTCNPVDCTTGAAGTVDFTYTGAEAGDDTVAASFTDATGAKQQATASVTWTHIANTPPTVTVGGVTGGGAYEIGAVPAATCSVDDAEDGAFANGAAVLSAVTGPRAAFGLGSQTATCAYTDHGGLTASDAATYTIVDTVRPTLAGNPTTGPNAAGWYRGPVSIHWTAGDTGSGVNPATVPADSLIDAEGAALVASASVADNAGNTTMASSAPVKIDLTAPATSIDAPVDWRNAEVDVTLNPFDNLSGINSTAYSVDGGTTQYGTTFTISGEGVHDVAFWSSDKAGNKEAVKHVQVRIDLTPPSINHTLNPSPNAAGWNRADVTVKFICGDGLSGVAACTAPVTVTTNGTSTVHGEARDNAGNKSTDDAVVNLDKLSPTISGSVPAANAAGWYNNPVTVAWDCGDTGGSGVRSCAAPVVVGDGSDQSANGGVTDLADNTSSASVDGLNVDTVRPRITGAATTAPNANGWYSDDVVIHWTCSDDRSGVVACPADTRITGEGGSLGASALIKDRAGNAAVGVVTGIQIDRHAPTSTISTGTAVFNAAGWSQRGITVELSAVDGDDSSGVDAIKVTVDGGIERSYTAPLVLGNGIHTVEYRAVDAAGNEEAARTATFKVDTTPPVITATRTAANAAGWNNGPVTVTFTCSDNLSGVVACPAPVTLSAEGAAQYVVGQIADRADNTASVRVVDINIDTTRPTVAPTISANKLALNAAATASPNAADTLSGVASAGCDPVDTSRYGSFTVGCSAVDRAGNRVSGSVAYQVTVNNTKQSVLAQIQAAMVGASKKDAEGLDKAATKLSASLAPALWIDGNHPTDKKVFNLEKEAAQALVELVKQPHSNLSDATLQRWVDSISDADRALAVFAIADATRLGGDAKKLAEAAKELDKADDETDKGHVNGSIEHDGNAWQQAQEAIRKA